MDATKPSEPLPFPPVEMRRLVGPEVEALFDNPTGALIFPDVPPENFASVFDFGCGCGRLARQLMQQAIKPKRYLGIDLHRGMIEWCRSALTARDPDFRFEHLDVFNAQFNPQPERPEVLPFPAPDNAFTLVIAFSVFTHTVQRFLPHYLREVARIMSPDAILVSTWFLFDKRYFPMMNDDQNTLYINDVSPWNATIFDREWLQSVLSDAGLKVVRAVLPAVRGFQWQLHIQHAASSRPRVELPEDTAAVARIPDLLEKAFG